MAVAPLYIASMDLLKQRLRMTGASQTDCLAMIESAVQEARMQIFGALGSARAIEITSYANEDNPTTDNAIIRLRANAVELAMVKINLLRALPTLFFDNDGSKKEVWNEEGIPRRTSERYIRDEIARLESEIATGLSAMADPTEEQGIVRATLIEPSCKPTPPGNSIFGRYGFGGPE